MVAIATLIVDLLIAQEPKLEPMRTELLVVVTTIGGLLMSTIAAEDVSLNNMVGKTEANPQTVINQSSAPIPPTIINTAPEPPTVSTSMGDRG